MSTLTHEQMLANDRVFEIVRLNSTSALIIGLIHPGGISDGFIEAGLVRSPSRSLTADEVAENKRVLAVAIEAMAEEIDRRIPTPNQEI